MSKLFEKRLFFAIVVEYGAKLDPNFTILIESQA